MLHYFHARWITTLCLVAPMLFASLPAQAQNRMNSKAVAVTSNGPVNNVEAVKFVGAVVVNSRVAADPDFGSPSLLMEFDLTGVTGTSAQSGTKYVLTSQEYVIRPLAQHQNVEFTFPHGN